MADTRLGTSSFTATGWQGSFYPKGLLPADYLSYYAQHFDTVEIDSTFYATPKVSVVRSWNAKTPEGFRFAAKVLQLCGVDIYVAPGAWCASNRAIRLGGAPHNKTPVLQSNFCIGPHRISPIGRFRQPC